MFILSSKTINSKHLLRVFKFASITLFLFYLIITFLILSPAFSRENVCNQMSEKGLSLKQKELCLNFYYAMADNQDCQKENEFANVCRVVKKFRQGDCEDFSSLEKDKQNLFECKQLEIMMNNESCDEGTICKMIQSTLVLPIDKKCLDLGDEGAGICYALRELWGLDPDQTKKQIKLRKDFWLWNQAASCGLKEPPSIEILLSMPARTLYENNFADKALDMPKNFVDSPSTRCEYCDKQDCPGCNFEKEYDDIDDIRVQYFVNNSYFGADLVSLFKNYQKLASGHLVLRNNSYARMLKELNIDPTSAASELAYQKYLQQKINDFSLEILYGKLNKHYAERKRVGKLYNDELSPSQAGNTFVPKMKTGFPSQDMKYIYYLSEKLDKKMSLLKKEVEDKMKKQDELKEALRSKLIKIIELIPSL
ncbi:MAG: hypothetical protein HQK51_03600 [Oligoflexia bacterium]|nr:hypothetical protein [Oligoflexia bacterium]